MRFVYQISSLVLISLLAFTLGGCTLSNNNTSPSPESSTWPKWSWTWSEFSWDDAAQPTSALLSTNAEIPLAALGGTLRIPHRKLLGIQDIHESFRSYPINGTTQKLFTSRQDAQLLVSPAQNDSQNNNTIASNTIYTIAVTTTTRDTIRSIDEYCTTLTTSATGNDIYTLPLPCGSEMWRVIGYLKNLFSLKIYDDQYQALQSQTAPKPDALWQAHTFQKLWSLPFLVGDWSIQDGWEMMTKTFITFIDNNRVTITLKTTTHQDLIWSGDSAKLVITGAQTDNVIINDILYAEIR